MSGAHSLEIQSVVRAAAPSLESVPYASVAVEFTNCGAALVEVKGYDIVWPEGRFSISNSTIALAPGEARTITVRVPVSSGNIDALVADPSGARIEGVIKR